MANKAEKGGGNRTPITPSFIYQRPSGSAPSRSGTRPPDYHAPPPPSQKARRRRPTSGNNNYNRNRSQNSTRNAAGRRASNRSNSSYTPKPTPPVAKTIVPPAPPKPVAPSLQKFLAGDSTYQQQMAAYGKAMTDFSADQGLARSDYTTNYNNTFRDIGLAKTDAAKSLQDDYAGRGLLKSGLYNQSVGELNQQYQNQYGDLGKQQTAFLSQLMQDLGKFKNEQTTQKQNAQSDAARRRADKYNL